MEESVPGWREKEYLTPQDGDDIIYAITYASRGHDGWVCPHCNYKQSFKGRELSNKDCMELLFGEDPFQEYCYSCERPYYVKADTAIRFSSRTDTEFTY